MTGPDDWLADARGRIDAALAGVCSAPRWPDVLAAAVTDAVTAPGKRVRPILTLMACEAAGGLINDAMPAAIAVELIHAYSLIHDDLPAMDDDDLRRGRPTTHVQFGEATAILAGDALQPLAFAQLAEIEDLLISRRCVRELAAAAGGAGLVGGQADDLATETIDPDSMSPAQSKARVDSIHRRKTGAMIVAAARMGAICGRADDATLAAVTKYSRSLGLLFQIIDDYLDETATAEQMGKRTGKDSGRGKWGYPALLARMAGDGGNGTLLAIQSARSVHAKAIDAAGLLGNRGDRLKWLADFVLERNH